MQLISEQIKLARLKAESNMSDFELSKDWNTNQSLNIANSELELFKSKKQALNSQISLYKTQIQELQSEITNLCQQISAEQKSIQLLQEETDANEKLVAKGFIQKTKLLQLLRGISDYNAAKSEHLANLSRAKQKISDLEIRISGLKSDYITQATSDLETTQKKIKEIEEKMPASVDAQKRQSINAPISGVVTNLKIHTINGVIAAKEPILDIIPQNKELIIETKINTADIDEVKINSRADLKFLAFNQRKTPLSTGNVIYISADKNVDDVSKTLYYLVRIKSEPTSIKSANIDTIIPGMPVEVFIKTRSRTLFDYLIEPITDGLRRAGRES